MQIEELNALSAEKIAAQLNGPPAGRASFVRAAAEAGVVEAQAVYGQILLDGLGVERDARAAFGWFAKAAASNHLLAINMVGRCYELGWGVGVDKVAAARWFRRAAEGGLDWGLYNYATSLTLGEGVAPDRAEALTLFRRAATMGNAKAMNYVGSFHEDGWVVDCDMDAAFLWYMRAAEGGDFRGQFNVARLLIARGDVDAALGWLTRVPDTATAAFMEKAAAWLQRSSNESVRRLANTLRPKQATASPPVPTAKGAGDRDLHP